MSIQRYSHKPLGINKVCNSKSVIRLHILLVSGVPTSISINNTHNTLTHSPDKQFDRFFTSANNNHNDVVVQQRVASSKPLYNTTVRDRVTPIILPSYVCLKQRHNCARSQRLNIFLYEHKCLHVGMYTA